MRHWFAVVGKGREPLVETHALRAPAVTTLMEQLSEFIVNHWILVTAFCVVLGLLISSLLGGAGGVSPQQAVMMMNRENARAVDVRPEKDFAAGHILDAVHLPAQALGEAGQRLKGLGEQPLLVYCASGATSAAAVKQIRQAGFERVQQIRGGMAAWQQENLPVTTD